MLEHSVACSGPRGQASSRGQTGGWGHSGPCAWVLLCALAPWLSVGTFSISALFSRVHRAQITVPAPEGWVRTNLKCQWPSRVLLCVTQWTVAHQAPLSMAFSRPEYWSGVQCPPPGDLLDPGIEPASLTSPALAGGFFATSATWEFTFRISGGGTFSQTRSLDPSPPPLRPPLSGL